jgi:transposase
MPATSKAELYAAIRRDLRAGMSAREIQRTRHVTWRTVKAASESAWPAPRAAYPERGSKLDPFKPLIEEMLVADLDAPRKQRHTATRIFNRLVDEHNMGDVSYDTVRAYVARRRPEVRAEHGRGAPDVFVPQTHLPGREAEGLRRDRRPAPWRARHRDQLGDDRGAH